MMFYGKPTLRKPEKNALRRIIGYMRDEAIAGYRKLQNKKVP
jgi:hypothetical protein